MATNTIRPEGQGAVPMLFPLEPAAFWSELRRIVQEEVTRSLPPADGRTGASLQVAGLTQKPLFKVKEVCTLFGVSRPTVYEWIRLGKLHPVKIRSRVFFLGKDLAELLAGSAIPAATHPDASP